MFILLVGPKGSGKSHIGRLLEERLGVFFCHVEPLWMAYYAECQAAGRQPVIAEGIAKVHPAIVSALAQHEHVCVETTGASAEILQALLALKPRSETLVARVTAPIEVCMERISSRDQTHQIPMELELIRKMYTLSQSLELKADLKLENAGRAEAEVLVCFEDALNRRKGRQQMVNYRPKS